MKKLLLSALCLGTFAFTQAQSVIQVSGHITANTTWLKINQYVLNGYVFVDSLKTLTIEAGTCIKGDKASKGTLIVSRGAKIKALGTNVDPIIFTSNEAIGSRAAGDWGGVVICGKAPNNLGTNQQLEGGYGAWHGGTTANDNSGVFKFVRIEFAGIALFPNQELNSLTLASVGSATVLHHVQVSYAGDDSYEWFGGTVNSRYLIAYNGVDDDFDTDNGYSGYNQWGIALRDPNIFDVSGSNGFESDNDAGSTTNTPKTRAVFTNYTMYGASSDSSFSYNALFKNALQLRRNTEIGIYNSVFVGWPKGVLIDGATTIAGINGSTGVEFKNNVISGQEISNTFAQTGGSITPDQATWFASNNNQNLGYVALKTQNPYNLTLTPPKPRNFAVKVGSPLLTGADFTGSRLVAGGAALTAVTYRGAAGGNWAASAFTSWYNYDPQNTDYCLGCNYLVTPDNGGVRSFKLANEIENSSEELYIYPNPAGANTMLSFELASENTTAGTIEVYDITGKMVKQINQGFEPGMNEITFTTSDLADGLYVLKVVSGSEIKTSKILVSNK